MTTNNLIFKNFKLHIFINAIFIVVSIFFFFSAYFFQLLPVSRNDINDLFLVNSLGKKSIDIVVFFIIHLFIFFFSSFNLLIIFILKIIDRDLSLKKIIWVYGVNLYIFSIIFFLMLLNTLDLLTKIISSSIIVFYVVLSALIVRVYQRNNY